MGRYPPRPGALRALILSLCLLPLAARPALAGPAMSVFQQEAAMSPDALVARWAPIIRAASLRFGIPVPWIAAVLIAESGGHTMSAEGTPIVSVRGAMGLMQVMPQSWQAMQSSYGLGSDPFDPHDNIFAGTALLRQLQGQYGYPGLFAAYNDGPGMVEAHRQAGQMLPDETVAYVLKIARILRAARHGSWDNSVGPKAVDPGDLTAPSDSPPRPIDYPDDEDSGED